MRHGGLGEVLLLVCIASCTACGSDKGVVVDTGEDAGNTATNDATGGTDSAVRDTNTSVNDDSGATQDTTAFEDTTVVEDTSAPEDTTTPPEDTAMSEDTTVAQDTTVPPEDTTMGEDAAPDAPVSDDDPSVAGPYSTFETVERTLTRGMRSIPVVALVPASAEPLPLVLFTPGFQLESSRYSGMMERIASHGFVVVRADPDDPLLTVSHVAMAEDLSAVIDWALGAGSPIGGAVDSASVALFGHSLGGKVSTMAAASDDRVTALLGIDPVNGGNPFTGFSNELPDILPEVVAGLTIPVGFAGETTNGEAPPFGQACAPTEENFMMFYNAATSTPWAAQWDFAGASHMDFVENTAACFVCSACPAGAASPADVQDAMNTLAVAFFRRHLLGDTGMDPWLTGDRVPSSVTAVTMP